MAFRVCMHTYYTSNTPTRLWWVIDHIVYWIIHTYTCERFRCHVRIAYIGKVRLYLFMFTQYFISSVFMHDFTLFFFLLFYQLFFARVMYAYSQDYGKSAEQIFFEHMAWFRKTSTISAIFLRIEATGNRIDKYLYGFTHYSRLKNSQCFSIIPVTRYL